MHGGLLGGRSGTVDPAVGCQQLCVPIHTDTLVGCYQSSRPAVSDLVGRREVRVALGVGRFFVEDIGDLFGKPLIQILVLGMLGGAMIGRRVAAVEDVGQLVVGERVVGLQLIGFVCAVVVGIDQVVGISHGFNSIGSAAPGFVRARILDRFQVNRHDEAGHLVP